MVTIVLNGSPNSVGNTMTLANAVIRELEGEKKTVNLYQAHIIPCLACGCCGRNSNCVLDIRDEMGNLRQSLLAADRIVIASPLHFSSLSAPLVAAFSRLQPEWHAMMKHAGDGGSSSRKGALILTGGGLYPNMFEAGRIVAAAVFRTLDVAFAGIASASDTDIHPVAENQDALERAAELGKKLR